MTRSELPKVLVSACLLGQPVRYDGRASGHPDLLQRWQAEGRVVPLCPEVAGGLPTPRPAAEIPGGQGTQVLDGHAQVLTLLGEDVTPAFLAGAHQALALVQRHGIQVAVLKAGSPSCGNLLTYDGSFSGVKVAGQGVTAALLLRAGVQVFSELELPEAEQALGCVLSQAAPRR
ncbi:DUF523 domain-containing protein [Pseudomonas sp. S60]|uniref:DUF523 domain-containing protein n=1 Tax=unclassified Pseudomonas TaxID=196821 RepID=UPI001911695B|nr:MULTISPECIES: DUF523 domain-containing protein [unclassified Pseudomonas]MBK5006593.1 DUF523 domain-containing protein [Pseudomonas sp. S32]MBK5012760.1 DUF523 domain-containing protein [Pseudomonas sp. S60]